MQPPPSPPPQQPLAAGGTGPSRRGYFVAALLFLVLFVPSLLIFLNGLKGITEGLIRVVVPGATTVELEPGTWTVFYEHSGEFDGVTYNSSRRAPSLTAVVTGDHGERPVASSPASFNYNIGGHAGYSIGQVSVEEKGMYTFEATLADPDDTEEYLLALGQDLGRSTFLLVLGIFGMIGSGLIAFVVWLVVFILRYRAKAKPG